MGTLTDTALPYSPWRALIAVLRQRRRRRRCRCMGYTPLDPCPRCGGPW